MKKNYAVDDLQNELEQGSSFFKKTSEPVIKERSQDSPPPQKEEKKVKTERISERKTERTENRTEKRSVSPPFKRSTKRYSFEFFTDQLATLKKLEGQAMMNGNGFNKSDFVRRALDEFFENVGIELAKPQE